MEPDTEVIAAPEIAKLDHVAMPLPVWSDAQTHTVPRSAFATPLYAHPTVTEVGPQHIRQALCYLEVTRHERAPVKAAM